MSLFTVDYVFFSLCSFLYHLSFLSFLPSCSCYHYIFFMRLIFILFHSSFSSFLNYFDILIIFVYCLIPLSQFFFMLSFSFCSYILPLYTVFDIHVSSYLFFSVPHFFLMFNSFFILFLYSPFSSVVYSPRLCLSHLFLLSFFFRRLFSYSFSFLF